MYQQSTRQKHYFLTRACFHHAGLFTERCDLDIILR